MQIAFKHTSIKLFVQVMVLVMV